jgi:hypothetical protein
MRVRSDRRGEKQSPGRNAGMGFKLKNSERAYPGYREDQLLFAHIRFGCSMLTLLPSVSMKDT